MRQKKELKMYGKVLSAAVLPAAIILPNTGGSKLRVIFALAFLAIGVVALATTVASAVAKQVYKD